MNNEVVMQIEQRREYFRHVELGRFGLESALDVVEQDAQVTAILVAKDSKLFYSIGNEVLKPQHVEQFVGRLKRAKELNTKPGFEIFKIFRNFSKFLLF